MGLHQGLAGKTQQPCQALGRDPHDTIATSIGLASLSQAGDRPAATPPSLTEVEGIGGTTAGDDYRFRSTAVAVLARALLRDAGEVAGRAPAQAAVR